MSAVVADADWRPTAPLQNLAVRAELLRALRDFFAERGVLEVDTPLLASAPVTDPHIEAVAAAHPAAAGELYLQTSPEYAMKRLLAAGSGPIYQICKAFRRGERGARHNPEFTMVEWYRTGFTLEQLIKETAALVALAVGPRPLRVLSYREAFLQHLQIDPHTATEAELAACARVHSHAAFDQADRDTWLQLLISTAIEPQLGRGEFTAVSDFPAEQAALARVEPDHGGTPVARRFELFVDGVELANGYDELRDAAELERRWQRDLAQRRERGLGEPPQDGRLLAAMAAGLPACSGVALGLDRLLMLALGAASIDEVLAFPLERA